MFGCSKYVVYAAGDANRYVINYTHDPVLDFSFHWERGCRRMVLLTGPIPIGQAYSLLTAVSSERERAGSCFSYEGMPDLDRVVEVKQRALRSTARKMRLDPALACANELEGPCVERVLPGEAEKEKLEHSLRGRILFLTEIEKRLGENIFAAAPDVEDCLQVLCLEHRCVRWPGVGWGETGRLVCFRCGQEDRVAAIKCASCGSTCYHCENCLSLGESRLCQPLYAVPAPAARGRFTRKRIVPRLAVSLSPAQEEASASLRQFVLQPEQREKLVWAACGAGKTEVVFAAIAEILGRGGRVLFAIPRRDPVFDVAPRIKRAFPGVTVSCHYGGSGEKDTDSRLVIATTHQVLRFYSRFDLIILDEVDAYPYNEGGMLRAGVARARKQGGKIIYMTATPSRELYSRWKENRLPCVRIPVRHHGYPLPEPKLLVVKNLEFEKREAPIPEPVVEAIHQTLEGDLAQLFIFVPSVLMGMQVTAALQKLTVLPPFNNFEGRWVEFSHSRDEEREAKRKSFLRGDFPILVTTTIYERGITVEKANVLVLSAHVEKIFDTAVLIQIAGRAGRLSSYPCGRVWFAGARITDSMRLARDRIRELNAEAARCGHLRPDSAYWRGREREKC